MENGDLQELFELFCLAYSLSLWELLACSGGHAQKSPFAQGIRFPGILAGNLLKCCYNKKLFSMKCIRFIYYIYINLTSILIRSKLRV